MRSGYEIRVQGERDVSAAKRAAGLRYMNGHHGLSSAEIEARRAEIPIDTRTLTARICGDPLPGRSALDQRGGMA